jgi:hypothetical protein
MSITTPDEATQENALHTPVEEPKKKGSRAVLNFWLDVALFVAIIFVMWLSVMLQVVFPPGTAASGWRLWGMSYDQWRNVQFGALCIFALLGIEHLVLHWNWVVSIIATRILRLKKRPDEGLQVVIGVGTFITVLVTMMVTLLTAMLTVQGPN